MSHLVVRACQQMEGKPEATRRSAHARDAAALMLRRATQLTVAVMVAVGGTFTALAAGSTPARKTAIVRIPIRRLTPAAVLIRAPAPPLVGAQSAPPPPSQAPPPTIGTPAPAPSYQQPVAVSGGS